MRTKNKIFRLTELQNEQIERYLESEKISFTDFIHALIQQEIMKDIISVQAPPFFKEKIRVKVKTELQIIKRYQKTDPDLLLEISRIGNNLNQIARALNVIKNADLTEQKNLDILSLFLVLKGIQDDLGNLFPKLPKISRQSPERLQKQLSSIQLTEEDENAY